MDGKETLKDGKPYIQSFHKEPPFNPKLQGISMGLGIPDISIGKGMAVSRVEGQISIMENTTQKSLLAGNQSQIVAFHFLFVRRTAMDWKERCRI